MRGLIQAIGNNSHTKKKIRVILNKCDEIKGDDLPGVVARLQQSLTPLPDEVPTIYKGSFSDERPPRELNRDERELYGELQRLASDVIHQKVGDLKLRVRRAKAHASLLHNLRSRMPWIYCKARRQQYLIDNLGSVFRDLGT